MRTSTPVQAFRISFSQMTRTLKRTETTALFLFSNFDYFPLQEINSNLRFGYKREDQIGEINSGLSGIFTANANNFFIKDYMTNGQLVLAYEDLEARRVMIMT